jgi:uncharacterized protein (TIGR02996 family)
MTTQDAFLQAIIANPDDDAPRLIYADWLDEHGQSERAEFIRAQIELARPPAPRTRTRRRELERRVKALWKRHGADWARERGGGSDRLPDWERGFCAQYGTADFTTLAAELPRRLAEAPIRHVALWRTTREDVSQLVSLPLLSGLHSLTLFAAGLNWNDALLLHDDDVRLLTECPYLARLEALDLTQHRIGPEGLHHIAHATALPALRDLALYGNRCGDDALLVIARSPLAARLRKLHTSASRDAPLTAAGARVLATTPAFRHLRVLNLDNTDIGDAGAKRLADAAHLAGLTELWLHSCEIHDAGVRAIAASPHLADLEVLDLSSNWTVGHAAAVALVESPYLRRIRSLDLWRCERLSRDDERMLRKRFRSRVNFARSY